MDILSVAAILVCLLLAAAIAAVRHYKVKKEQSLPGASGDDIIFPREKWVCAYCETINKANAVNCCACGNKKEVIGERKDGRT